MKVVYALALSTLLLTGCGDTVIIMPPANDQSADTTPDNNETTQKQVQKEQPAKQQAPEPKQTEVETVDSNAVDYAAPSENMNLYTTAEIDRIVNNIIRPTAYKIKGMVDNKQLAPVSKTNVETTYQVDNITLIIYNDGTLYAEYTYYNNQLFVVVPYVNKQIKNRYYYYNNDLIYILYPDKSDKYRPDFTDKDIQLGINALNHQF